MRCSRCGTVALPRQVLNICVVHTSQRTTSAFSMSGGLGAWPGNRSQNAHRAARCSVRWTGRRRGGSAKPSLRLGTFEHAADGLVCSCAGDGGTAPAQKGSSESSSHGFPNEFDNMLAKPADLTAGARGGPAHPWIGLSVEHFRTVSWWTGGTWAHPPGH